MSNSFNLVQSTDLCLGVKHFFPRAVVPFVVDNEKLTPSPASIITGQFQELKALRHKHLCEYVELIRGKHGMNKSKDRRKIETNIDEYFS